MGEPDETEPGTVSPLPDVFSRRKRLRSGVSDPLRYNEVPHKVRMQILHVLDDAITLDAVSVSDSRQETFEYLVKFFRRELGVAKLSRSNQDKTEFSEWFLGTSQLEEVVDAIELVCRIIQHMARRSAYNAKTGELNDLVSEINARLMEAGIGFQFEDRQVVEASSRYLHAEVIVPALALVSGETFAAANSEFLDAHEAFREADYEKCLVECCKAFESVMKVIADERDWDVAPGAPAKVLVKAVFDNELIPKFLESEFAGIRSVLENGINTLRNKAGGHGAGTKVRDVPRHLAAFQLHQTGAAIALLVEAHLATT